MNFLVEHSSMDEKTLRKELIRYISWPGEVGLCLKYINN